MAGIIHVAQNEPLTGLSEIQLDVEFSRLGLKCAILTPWYKDRGVKYPAIVFVQGSAWQFPDICYEIPQLAWYASRGYVVMTITHRNRQEGHPFPAFLQDTKCAIRYLRANAEFYHVDKERIAVWGTSSGGNTSMLVHLTGDDPAYRTEEYAEESDSVRCAVECFGPSDLVRVAIPDDEHMEFIDQLRGTAGIEETAKAMSPLYQINKDKLYAPILMLHGSGDPVVDYETQCLPMYEKYLEAGVDVQLICVDDAPHEGSFWSREVHEHILAFLDAQLK